MNNYYFCDVCNLNFILMTIKVRKNKLLLLFLLFLIILGIYIAIPPERPLFNDPFSSVILDRNGELLSAQIASDGQWRFPQNALVPVKFEKAIVVFEDKRFYSHWGVDIMAMFRALWLNAKHADVVSGGSTLSMQVIRLSRKGKARTYWEKVVEVLKALRLDAHLTKQEILALYASHAPFGGNVVGLDAAAWRYFGRKSVDLSWAESCMLAVLPNSPSLIHLGRNRDALKIKRDKLLLRLKEQGVVTNNEYALAVMEELPDQPRQFPMLAPHLLERVKNKSENAIFHSSINAQLQIAAQRVLERNYTNILEPKRIHNAALVVLDVETKEVIVYHGNIPHFKIEHNYFVDCAGAPRSTGSVLKPFLYCSMLSDGEILPWSLIPDVPVNLHGYAPQNFNRAFEGAVPASRALARSLNIPAVLMLKKYGLEKFYEKLPRIGINTVRMPAQHYGLSIILGGCEGSLLEITSAYAGMAKSLNNFGDRSGYYSDDDYGPPRFFIDSTQSSHLNKYSPFSASSIWYTFLTMLSVDRPDDELNWREFSSSQKICWKTGTSFGFRDAWAVGVTSKYAVGVWVGNADGEGMPEIIGIRVAAPVLFDVFHILNDVPYFERPHDDFIEIDVCSQSGYLAGVNCDKVTRAVPKKGVNVQMCPYHKKIQLNKNLSFRVHADCYNPSEMVDSNWFILPPTMEYYFKMRHSSYTELPSFLSSCLAQMSVNAPMDIIYPQKFTRIYVPKVFGNKQSDAIFHVAHSRESATVYWHIDDEFIEETNGTHKIPVNCRKGRHTLTVVDDEGFRLKQEFEIVSEME